MAAASVVDGTEEDVPLPCDYVSASDGLRRSPDEAP